MLNGPMGKTFLSSRYQDGMRLLMPETTNSTAVTHTPVAVADPDRPYEEVRALSGIVEMGPADGLLVLPLGTDALNETATIFVSRYDPVVQLNSAGRERVIAWTQLPVGAWSVVLNSTAAGDALALLDGVETGDKVPFNVQPGTTTAQWALQDGSGATQAYRTSGTAIAGGWNHFIQPAFGAPFLRLQGVVGTAATILAIGRRVSGLWAYPAR